MAATSQYGRRHNPADHPASVQAAAEYASLPPAMESGKTHGRIPAHIRVDKSVALLHESQVWVTVTSRGHALSVVEPYDSLLRSELIASLNGVVHVESDKPLRVLMAIFISEPKDLVKPQFVRTLLPHPMAIWQSHLTIADVLGTARDTIGETACAAVSDFTVGRSEAESPDKQHGLFSDQLLDDVPLEHVAPEQRSGIRDMLSRYSRM